MMILKTFFFTLIVVTVMGGRLDRMENQMRSLDLKLDGYTFDISSLKKEVSHTNMKLDMIIEMLNNSETTLMVEDMNLKTEEMMLVEDSMNERRILRLNEMENSVDSEITRVKRAFGDVKSSLMSQKLTNEESFQTFAQTLNETLAILDGKFEGKLVAATDLVNGSVIDVLNRVSEKVHGNLNTLNTSVHETLDYIEQNEISKANETVSNLAMLDARIGKWNESFYVTMHEVKDILNKQVIQMSTKEQALVKDIKAELTTIANEVKSTVQQMGESGTVSTISQTITSFKEQVSNSLTELKGMFNRNVQSNVRLANAKYGQSYGEGRLEVFMNNAWGTVCDDTFCVNAAKVACKMFGYDKGEVKGGATYGSGSGPIFMDEIHCRGSEQSLFSCPYDRKHNCGHGEDVGVKCTYN